MWEAKPHSALYLAVLLQRGIWRAADENVQGGFERYTLLISAGGGQIQQLLPSSGSSLSLPASNSPRGSNFTPRHRHTQQSKSKETLFGFSSCGWCHILTLSIGQSPVRLSVLLCVCVPAHAHREAIKWKSRRPFPLPALPLFFLLPFFPFPLIPHPAARLASPLESPALW